MDASKSGSIPVARVVELLQNASKELRALDVGHSVDRVPLRHLSPMRFATEYVARNKPVVVTGALESWLANSLWNGNYLANHPAGQTVVTVDVTPNGRGDALTTVADPVTGDVGRWFVTPHERRMKLKDFISFIRKTRTCERRLGASTTPREVPYLQHQNSNLTEELGLLLGDIAPGLPWAEQVFGGPPEATNIWIGDGRSVTSFHKAGHSITQHVDRSTSHITSHRLPSRRKTPCHHYENLYAVLRGTKVFSLLPPGDLYRMYLTRGPAAVYMPASEVPPGAVWREVSTEPGGAPSGGAVSVMKRTAVEAGVDEEGAVATAREKCSERLVAVLQDPGYQVLWSAVDSTVEEPALRRSQPLFYGCARPPTPPGTATATATPPATANTVLSADSFGTPDSDRDDEDPWEAVGGAPMLAEVGPGDLFYLPALWYHQVEQRTTDKERRVGVAAAATAATAAGGFEGPQVPAGSRVGAAEFGGVQEDGGDDKDDDGDDDKDDLVIAVNFWYDMKYDSRYSSFKFLESLAIAAGLVEDPPLQETDV